MPDTSNFAFLHAQWPELFSLGKDAEGYPHNDPQSCVIKLRCFIEHLVGYLYRDLRIPPPAKDDLFERLNNENFRRAIETHALDKIHAIRMKGNRAAHHGGVTTNDALWLLREAHLLGCWLFMTRGGGTVSDCLLAPIEY